MAQSDESKSLKQITDDFTKSKKDHIKNLEKLGKTQEEVAAAIKQMAVSHKMHLQAERDEAYKQRKDALVKELQEKKGMDETNAKREVSAQLDLEKKRDAQRLKRDKSFFGRMINAVTPKSDGAKDKLDKEKQIEDKRERKGFFKSLKDMFGKKNKEAGAGVFGFMTKIFSKIKGVFKFIVGKFLLIGALVVGLIASMNMDQLKETWKKLKEAFKAIWEFLEPIVTYIWDWIKESLLPATIKFFMDTVDTITEVFTNIKKHFEGWGEMTLEEKVKAVFNAIGELAQGFVDLGGNIVKWVMGAFGASPEAIASVDKFTQPIKDFFKDMYDALGKLFTGDWKGALKTAWDGLFGKKEGELGGFVGFVWNKVIKPVFDWIKNIVRGMVDKFPKVKAALKWLGIGDGGDEPKPPKTDEQVRKDREEADKRAAIVAAEKEKKARLERGKTTYKDVDTFFRFSKTAGNTGLDEKKLNKLSMSQMEQMRDYMISEKKFKGEEAKEINKALERLREKKKKDDIKNAKIDADQQAKRDAGKFGTFSEFHASAEGKAFMKTYKDEKTFKKTGKIGVTTKKAKERAFAAYQAMGHVGVMDTSPSYSELDTIKRHEGFRAGVYKDSVRTKKNPHGIDTIGYGFNLERSGAQDVLDKFNIKKSVADLRSGKVNLTEEEASRLVQGEMGHFKGVAERYVGTETWKKLSPNRQGILTNMAYNMGEGSLNQFENLRTALQKGNFKEAQKQMMNSKWAKDVKGRAVELTARMGADDKSNALNSVQQANFVAKETKGASPGSITVTKGGDTTIHKEETTMLAGTAVDLNHPQNTRQTTTTT